VAGPRRAVPRCARAEAAARRRGPAAAGDRRRPRRLARRGRAARDDPRALHGPVRPARRLRGRAARHAGGDRRLPRRHRGVRPAARGDARSAAGARADHSDRRGDGPRGGADAGRGEGALRPPPRVRQRGLHDRDQHGLRALVRAGRSDRGGVGRLARRPRRLLRLRDPLLRGLALAHAARTRRADPGCAAAASVGPRGRVGARGGVRASVDRLLRARLVDAGLLPGAGLERDGGRSARGSDERGGASGRARHPLPRRSRRVAAPVAGADRRDAARGDDRDRGPAGRWMGLGGARRLRDRRVVSHDPDAAARRGARALGDRRRRRPHAGGRLHDHGRRAACAGAVRDFTGSFSTSLWVLVAVAAAFVASVLALSPQRLRPPPQQVLKPEAISRA
jgi:hypothetical protein